jgi:hypothetical protein
MYSLMDAGVPVERAAVEQCLRARAARGEEDAEVSAQEEDDADMCCICLERPRNALVMPCKHLCLCTPCGDVDACPICRGPAQQVITGIFL